MNPVTHNNYSAYNKAPTQNITKKALPYNMDVSKLKNCKISAAFRNQMLDSPWDDYTTSYYKFPVPYLCLRLNNKRIGTHTDCGDCVSFCHGGCGGPVG